MDRVVADLDFLRDERRFCLLPGDGENLCRAMKEEWEEICFSPNQVAFTIYLDTDEHDIPHGTSIHLRRFIKKMSPPRWPESDQFRFEIKSKVGEYGRKKDSVSLFTLSEALSCARETLNNANIRPYIATMYLRRHFVQKNRQPIRMTIDRDITYWFFENGDRVPKPLGKEKLWRVELKSPSGSQNKGALDAVLHLLRHCGASDALSKKEEGYLRVLGYLTSRFGKPIIKDMPGYEVEAKAFIHHSEPFSFFHQWKAWAKKDTFPILLSPNFPFTCDTSSYNHYWAQEIGGELQDGLKILSCGSSFGVVLKSEFEVLDRSLGIVKRREIKGEKRYTPGTYRDVVDRWEAGAKNPRYLGLLRRYRRAIWLVERESGRIYHVSSDLCTSEKKPESLRQLEIEYVGRLAEGKEVGSKLEDIAVSEISYLMETFLKLANRGRKILEPTVLTKFKWLAS